MAQTTGHFEVYDFGTFKLHVYYTNDALGDASYIVESGKALVTMEQPLFKANVAEFDAYLTALDKPVEKRITNYHVGGTGHHDIVMAKGMPAFTQGAVYGGMMAHFAQIFGDALTEMPTGKIEEVAFNSIFTWADITFDFRRGASSDFPGASILIGGKVYYTHWAPVKAHISHLQISSAVAIDAELAEAEKSLASGAELFIGGHGGAATRETVEFKIAYLKKMKELLNANRTAPDFENAMRQAWPNLAGEAGLKELSETLYK